MRLGKRKGSEKKRNRVGEVKLTRKEYRKKKE